MEREETKLIKALMKDFAELYVKEYMTNWKEGRLVRNIELGAMSLRNTEEYISQELDKAREEGKLYALDNLKDYVFINDCPRNKDLPLTWDNLRHYIKEVEQIYSEDLSKLNK